MTVDGAIWRDQLTAAERAELGRGHATIPDRRPDILVVGGGIMGVATAAACHEAGLGSVLLIETGRLGTGATGGASGLLIPEPHRWSDPEPLVDLERASLERWRELEQAAASTGSGLPTSTGSAWRRIPVASRRTSRRRWNGWRPGRWSSSSPAWPGPWRAR